MSWRCKVLLPWLALLGACQPSFAVERHILGPFRLAAMGVVDGEARAAIWSGSGPTHAVAPVLRWSADGAALGEGQGLPVPAGVEELELEVVAPDGGVHRGRVTVTDCAAALGLERAVVSTAGSLSLEARRRWEGQATADGPASEEDGLRLTASPSGFSDTPALRWMIAGTEATVLELDTLSADVLAEKVVFDDGELESRKATGAALHHGLALGVDGTGCSRWAWLGLPFGIHAPLLALGESRVAVDGALPDAELVSADLWIDTSGVPRLSGVEAEPDENAALALPCGDGAPVMDPDWMWSGRCSREELHGSRVLLRVTR